MGFLLSPAEGAALKHNNPKAVQCLTDDDSDSVYLMWWQRGFFGSRGDTVALFALEAEETLGHSLL